MPDEPWAPAQALWIACQKQVMGTHSGFAEDQLLVAPQTFQVDEGRDGDQLTSRLGLGNGPFS